MALRQASPSVGWEKPMVISFSSAAWLQDKKEVRSIREMIFNNRIAILIDV
jgi:hypothetical protein